MSIIYKHCFIILSCHIFKLEIRKSDYDPSTRPSLQCLLYLLKCMLKKWTAVTNKSLCFLQREAKKIFNLQKIISHQTNLFSSSVKSVNHVFFFLLSY